jgi:predicted transcriptional regulator of viral defense system
MKAQEFFNHLRSQGKYSFQVQEAEQALGLTKIATLNALKRLKPMITSPARGFYLIVPPEFQALGCLPADMFIQDLMKYFALPYYVGFLSAAQYYGAAHQKPQRFQVVTTKNRRPIKCGRVYIEFIANKNVAQGTTKKFNTSTGFISVATPETLAIDLVTGVQRAAGINNVATVLTELAESINSQALLEKAKTSSEMFWVQRLGYLFDQLGLDKLSNALFEIIKEKKLHWVKLVPESSYKAIGRNSKWKIIINTEVEVDE